MRRFKVAVVIGARPQFIKAAALARAHRQSPLGRQVAFVWIHTGQHYDRLLSDIFFDELSIPKPQYHLGVGPLPQGAQMGLMMSRIEGVLKKEKPNGVLVFGDTNSTLAGALTAAKLSLAVFHVEAGLRSFNSRMPEEINRIATDRLSSLHFCPTADSARQLKKEGLGKSAHVVGDVMADTLYFYDKKLRQPKQKKTYYLATIHRNTNTDDPSRLEKVFRALGSLGNRVILPLHPRTREKIRRNEAIRRVLRPLGDLKLIKPVSYLKMLNLEKHSLGVITDSGGVQKEAFMQGVPCVTLRDETEWKETVRHGLNTLCKPEPRAILRAMQKMGEKKGSAPKFLYGKGDASKKIIKIMVRYLSGKDGGRP